VGLQSFDDLRGAGKEFIPLFEQKSDTRLSELAPLSIRLRNGRQTKVHYDQDRPPWISSRLQDFFQIGASLPGCPEPRVDWQRARMLRLRIEGPSKIHEPGAPFGRQMVQT